MNKNNLKGLSFFSLLMVCVSAHAATTITVDDNARVQVNQGQSQTVVAVTSPVVVTTPVVVSGPVVVSQVVSQPTIVAVSDNSLNFSGEIERIDRITRTIDVMDTEGRIRQVLVTQQTIDTYRTGDFVQIQSVANVREVIFIRQESKLDLEGRIIRVDATESNITVHDTQGRDRRILLKQGMISNYKVGDYVRIHLMADEREAKMIRTIR